MSDAKVMIIMGPEALHQLVREAVREELAARDGEAHAPPPEWIDAKGAAQLLGVGERTVRKLASNGKLPASKVGEKLLRFRRADVVAYLERTSG